MNNRLARRRFVYGAIAASLALVSSFALANDGDHALGAAAPADADAVLRLVISLDDQRIDVYRGTEVVDSAPVSTGRRGHATPAGVYSILEKRKWHRSNIYSGTPMPYMQRITWSGLALHAGPLPGRPASHGCVRLPKTFAKSLFGSTGRGTDVIITHQSQAFRPIAHEALFGTPREPQISEAGLATPITAGFGLPAPAELASAADRTIALAPAPETTEAARSTSPIRILITRRDGRERARAAQRLLNELGHDAGTADGVVGRATRRAIKAFQAATGLAVTGSLSTDLLALLHETAGKPERFGHLYVRRDHKDLFDAPIELAGPTEPLGTHFFSVERVDADGNADWSVIGLTGPDGPSAEEVLSRLVIPDVLRQRIEAHLTPGSSVIVTDAGRGRETGRGTDFIVQPR